MGRFDNLLSLTHPPAAITVVRSISPENVYVTTRWYCNLKRQLEEHSLCALCSDVSGEQHSRALGR